MTSFSTHCVPTLHDNYVWLIQAANSPHVIVIDPGDDKPVIAYLEQHQLEPVAILVTHRHHDHVDGIKPFLSHYKVPVFGPINEFIPSLTHPLSARPSLVVHPDFPSFEVWDVPGHTEGHIAYFLENALFCGDTLFAAGCGRLLGGTHDQLFDSLSRLRLLKPDTLIYCSHEYTAANLRFAQAVEPNNTAIQQRIDTVSHLRAAHLPTLPSTIGLELETNPFLRCQHPTVIESAKQYAQQSLDSELDVFTSLRQWKDQF